MCRCFCCKGRQVSNFQPCRGEEVQNVQMCKCFCRKGRRDAQGRIIHKFSQIITNRICGDVCRFAEPIAKTYPFYTFLHSLHLYTAKNPRLLSSIAFARYLAKSLHTPTPLARKVFFCITVVAGRFGVLEIWRGFSWSSKLKWESGLFTFPFSNSELELLFVKLSQIGLL